MKHDFLLNFLHIFVEILTFSQYHIVYCVFMHFDIFICVSVEVRFTWNNIVTDYCSFLLSAISHAFRHTRTSNIKHYCISALAGDTFLLLLIRDVEDRVD